MKNYLLFLTLYVAWVVLVEGFTTAAIIMGLIVSIVSIYLNYKFLPLAKINETEHLNIFRFIIHALFLIGQIYVSALSSMKLIFTGADVDVVTVKTSVKNKAIRNIIANSFTLTPGSISLDINDDKITILCLKGCDVSHLEALKSAEKILNKFENILIKKGKS